MYHLARYAPAALRRRRSRRSDGASTRLGLSRSPWRPPHPVVWTCVWSAPTLPTSLTSPMGWSRSCGGRWHPTSPSCTRSCLAGRRSCCSSGQRTFRSCSGAYGASCPSSPCATQTCVWKDAQAAHLLCVPLKCVCVERCAGYPSSLCATQMCVWKAAHHGGARRNGGLAVPNILACSTCLSHVCHTQIYVREVDKAGCLLRPFPKQTQTTEGTVGC